MKKKRKPRLRYMFVVLVILTMMVSRDSFAYWASNIVAPNAVDSAATIVVGDWDQAFPYDGNNDYETGDLVVFNGNTYQATSSFWSNFVSPTGFLGFLGWQLVP